MNLRRKSQKVTEGVASKPTSPPKKATKINLNHKFIVITGTITGYTRSSAQAKIKVDYPTARFQSSISSTTDYLITGYGMGQRKLQLASRWNVKTIDATEIF